MIAVELARRLRAAGLRWTPAPGDRFVMADPAVRVRAGLDDVFVVSEMTVDVADTPGGPLIRFNGTTEWALDSVEKADVLWLPREEQLRELLGADFRRLEAVPGGFVVVVASGGGEERHVTSTPSARTPAPCSPCSKAEDARALLALPKG